jgi:hypothetical protein
MKNTAVKNLLILLLIGSFSMLHAQKKENSILGKWKGTDARTEKGGIEFLRDGTAKVMFMGQPLPINQYKVDSSKDPMPISLMVKRGGQEMTIYGLMKFIDKDTIKWEVFPMAQKQPTAFSDNAADTSVILKRE